MNKKNVISMPNKFFEYFSIKEFFPNCDAIEIAYCIRNNMLDSLLLLAQVLDSFRVEVGHPIVITSGFRDAFHNHRVHGSLTSQHMIGQAFDFYVSGINIDTAVRSFKSFMQRSALKHLVGQVIIHNSYIHIGLSTPNHPSVLYYDKRTSQEFN